MAEPQFRDTAAAGYDRSVGEMTRRFVPALLRAARLAPGQRVLDIGRIFARLAGAAAGGGQAIARTAVVPEAATRTATFGWRSRMTASAASCAAAACSRVSQNRTEAPRVGSSSERSQ